MPAAFAEMVDDAAQRRRKHRGIGDKMAERYQGESRVKGVHLAHNQFVSHIAEHAGADEVERAVGIDRPLRGRLVAVAPTVAGLPVQPLAQRLALGRRLGVGDPDHDDGLQDMRSRFGAPAYVRRARQVQDAFDALVQYGRVQREERLAMVRLRSRLNSLSGPSAHGKAAGAM